MNFFIVNHIPLLLIILGVIFMIAEMFVFSFGVLGIGGFIAFMTGLVILIDIERYGSAVALPLILTIGAVVAVFLFIMIRLGIKSHKKPIVSGRENLIGQVGRVYLSDAGAFQVKIRGEIWQITAEETLVPDQVVKVVAVTDLVLKVVPAEEKNND